MKKSIFIIFILCFNILSTNTQTLKMAEKWGKSYNKTLLDKSYVNYKILYLRARLNNDKELERKSLKGIIHIGGKLSKNIVQYENKLNDLEPKKIKEKKLVKTDKKIINNYIKNDELYIEFNKKIKKSDIKYLSERKIYTYEYTFKIKAKIYKNIKIKTKKAKKVAIVKYNKNDSKLLIQNKTPLTITYKIKKYTLIIKINKRKYGQNIYKNYTYENKKIILNFEKELKKKDINYFNKYDKKEKVYKYYLTILANTNIKEKIKHDKIKDISLFNYKENFIRIIFKNTKKLRLSFFIKKNSLIINTGLSSKNHLKKFSKRKTITKEKTNNSYTVVIDPGHGGKDPGAVGYKNYYEKNIVLKVSKYLKKELLTLGYKVHMSRDKDKSLNLKARTDFANKKKSHIFISIHINSVSKRKHKVYGIETYFLSHTTNKRAKEVAAKENIKDVKDLKFFTKNNFLLFLNKEKTLASKKLAIDIQAGIYGHLKSKYKYIKDNGVKEGPFWVLVGAQMPAILVELGFITNKREAMRLNNAKYQRHIAKGIAAGIRNFFIKNP